MSGDDGDDVESDEEDEDQEESSGEAESGESDSEQGDDEAADEVRKKIEDALKGSGVDVAETDSEEDSDEELMDDEQMMALDDTLANIFRSRTNERKSKKGSWTLSRRAFLDTQVISRSRCPTRSNALQEQSPRSCGYLCKTGASESSQRTSRPTVGRTRDKEHPGRTPTIRQGKRYPQKSTRQIKRRTHDRAARRGRDGPPRSASAGTEVACVRCAVRAQPSQSLPLQDSSIPERGRRGRWGLSRVVRRLHVAKGIAARAQLLPRLGTSFSYAGMENAGSCLGIFFQGSQFVPKMSGIPTFACHIEPARQGVYAFSCRDTFRGRSQTTGRRTSGDHNAPQDVAEGHTWPDHAFRRR